MKNLLLATVLTITSAVALLAAGDPLVEYINPSFIAPPPNGAFSHVSVYSNVKDLVFVAGQRGRVNCPANPGGCLVPLDVVNGLEGHSRIRQAYQNMKDIAESQGSGLQDCVRIVVYVTDIKYRATANAIQDLPEFWGDGLKPPRTIVVVTGLNENDIFEVEGTFARK